MVSQVSLVCKASVVELQVRGPSLPVGAVVGLPVGNPVGPCVGCRDGCSLGASVGRLEGLVVGFTAQRPTLFE